MRPAFNMKNAVMAAIQVPIMSATVRGAAYPAHVPEVIHRAHDFRHMRRPAGDR
jgi:hypothetical protein